MIIVFCGRMRIFYNYDIFISGYKLIMEKLTTETFIKKAIKKHGNKYDYSNVEYINSKTKICIICPIHGEFWQTPAMHLYGNGCPKCKAKKQGDMHRKTNEQFIKEARAVHGNKYDYSKVEYKGTHTKVCIICPKHGEFWQTPRRHLEGDGCPKCYGNAKLTTEEFIKRAKNVHGDKYDYSKVEYKNSSTKISIICPIHGEFWQFPLAHLKGNNCPKCSHQSYKHTKESFIEQAIKIHSDKYDYSKVEYKNNSTKVCIICPIHGEFYQRPNSHMRGEGCPKCNESHMERDMDSILKEMKLDFEREKCFSWLKNNDGNNLKLDFYLPKYNLAIECQGLQHYVAAKTMGGYKGLKRRKENDQSKKKLCREHNIDIIYYGEKETITNKNDFLNEIKKWVK